MLKKFIGDPASILHLKGEEVYDKFYYEEVPIEFFDWQGSMEESLS